MEFFPTATSEDRCTCNGASELTAKMKELYQKEWIALHNFIEHLKKMETSPPELSPIKVEKGLHSKKGKEKNPNFSSYSEFSDHKWI